MITEVIFFSQLFILHKKRKRERESTDNDCCHSSEQEREKETSNLRKRERESDKTSFDDRCHTSKTHKTLNDQTYELSHLYMYTQQFNRLSKFNRLDCYYCSCTTLQTAVFVLYIYQHWRLIASSILVKGYYYHRYHHSCYFLFHSQIDSCHVVETQ